MARVAIGVMACTAKPAYLAELRACEETWAPECRAAGIPVFYFDGEGAGPDLGPAAPFVVRLPGVGDDYASAGAKQWAAFARLPELAPADFYFVVGTDNYVWGERLAALLAKYNPDAPWAVGGFLQARVFAERYWAFPLGGAGVGLSRAAQAALAPLFAGADAEWAATAPPELRPACDVAFARLAEAGRVPLVREYDIHPCSWLYAYRNPPRVNVGHVDYAKAAVFHYMTPWDLRAYHFLRADGAVCRGLADAAAAFPELAAFAAGLERAAFVGDDHPDLALAALWGLVRGRLDLLGPPGAPLPPRASAFFTACPVVAPASPLAALVRSQPESEMTEETAKDHHLVFLTARRGGARDRVGVEARVAAPGAWAS